MVESVPNYSEGRRLDVVDRLAEAAGSSPRAFLLDRTSDASHNRSVLTLAGEPDAVMTALMRTVEVAIADIDMERQRGEHPRIGAVDVVPFVPLGNSTLDDCVGHARAFGAAVADRYRIPVYLYAAAATRPDRVKLADVRRGQYEGLRTEIASADRVPDFGPARTHPTAGAMAVGARPFLIAWNINLATDDLEAAKRVARAVRESGGGLPRVQGNGFWIEELGMAQVSMNLLDFSVTPIWRVWDAVEELASAEGIELAESELIGLAPLAALLDVADHAGADPTAADEERLAAAARYIKLRDFSPQQALEIRLAAARHEAARSEAERSEAGSSGHGGRARHEDGT